MLFRVASDNLLEFIQNIKWTSIKTAQWQEFYNNAARLTVVGGGLSLNMITLPSIPKYVDIKEVKCSRQELGHAVGLIPCEQNMVVLLFFSYLLRMRIG